MLQTVRGPESHGRAKLTGALGVFSLRAKGLGGDNVWPSHLGTERESTWHDMDRTRGKQKPLARTELMQTSERSKEKPVLGGSELPDLGGVQEGDGEVLAGIMRKASKRQF